VWHPTYMPPMVSSLTCLPHRAIVTLTGPDTLVLLERLVTNATENWTIGETRYGALLTPQGKVIADYLAVRTEDGVVLDAARAYASDLAKRLKMFRLRSQVEIEVREDLFVWATTEASSPEFEPPADASLTYTDPRYPGGRLRALRPAHENGALSAYHADRIANLVPEQGTDFGTSELFPADINMDALNGVALNKGCFVGQEVVSRMHRRGKIRKRTLGVESGQALEAALGAELLAPLPIGTLTSASGSIGLALIRTDRLLKAEAAGEPISLNENPVTVAKPGWLAAELAPMQEP